MTRSRLSAGMADIVTSEELRTLSDSKLLDLIVERSNLDREAAGEALEIIRGGSGDLIEETA